MPNAPQGSTIQEENKNHPYFFWKFRVVPLLIELGKKRFGDAAIGEGVWWKMLCGKPAVA
ncbi:MAG: hypothetical protein V2B18_17180 [Pseudomonadota bacterium]